jgi:hypothetical protein
MWQIGIEVPEEPACSILRSEENAVWEKWSVIQEETQRSGSRTALKGIYL